MSFEEVLNQASAMLQRRGRLTYRMLKRHFHLDAEALEDLTFELIKGQRLAIDEDGEVLVWTGEPLAATPDAQRVADAERRFHTLLPAVIGLLQSQRRVTYRTLTYVFSIDETLLEEIREELTFRRLAIDEGGKGLVWTGEVPSMTPPVRAVPSLQVTADTPSVTSPAAPTLPPSITETHTPSHEPTISADAIATDVPQAASTPVSEPTRPGPEAERRQLTVMFCDLADSTRLSQQLDAEDLREVVRAYQATAAAVIHQYEGHIAQYLGDGLLVYFGWPVAHEDDALRGVHAGLGIVAAITTTLNPRLQREKGVQLAVRIGLHTGPVVVGEMGGGGRHEHLATGDTVNIAARLEGLAAPNTVVISGVTARLVRQAFGLEDLGRHALKGVTEPMPVFRVLRPLETPADEPVAAGVPFLVGRDEELGLLRRRWAQAKERLGQVVLLSGTAGLGKSALTEVLRAQVRDEGWPRIAFRCSAYHQNSALYPVITHVERVLDVQREDAPATKLAKLEQGLRPYRLPLDEVVPLFAALLSVPLDGRYAAPTLSPQQQKQQTLDALVAWMLEEAERQPVLVAWEDLHWADPSTLEMLGLVLEQTPTVPMLHVLTYRPEFTPPWPTRSHMTPITLNRLERPQVEALITHLAGGKPLPAEVVQHIVAKTDGVPLYVEELTKMLLQSALLREDADHYTLTGPLGSVAIPDTLQDALMARLDQLHTAKEVAQVGAVLGREFAYEMLQALATQDEATLQAGLAQLVGAELLYQRGRPPRATYTLQACLDPGRGVCLVAQEHAAAGASADGAAVRDALSRGGGDAARGGGAALHRRGPGRGRHPLLAAGRPARPAGLGACGSGRAPDAGPGRADDAAGDAGTPPAGAGPPGGAGPGVACHPGACRPRGGTRLRPGPGAVCAARRHPAALPGAAGVDVVLSEARATYRRRPNSGSSCSAWPRPSPTRRCACSPTISWDRSCSIGASRPRPGPTTRRPWRSMTRRRTGPWRCATAWTSAWPLHGFLARELWYLGFPEQALQHSQAARTLAQEVAHPYEPGAGAGLCGHRASVPPRGAGGARAGRGRHDPGDGTGVCAVGGPGHGPARLGPGHAGPGRGGPGRDAAGARRRAGHGVHAVAAVFPGPAGGGVWGRRTPRRGVARAGRGAGRDWTPRRLRYYAAELSRLKGALLLQQAVPDAAQAEACFHQALDVARQQQAKSWELRAATSLARLWQSQDKRQDAYDLLAPVYEWFTEGFDTADLQEAQALLEEVSQ